MTNQTDFEKILNELYATGINDYELERQTGISRQRITKWRTGTRKTVDYDSGVKIVEIYENFKKNC